MPQIPALALSNPDADQLERIAAAGKSISVHIMVDGAEIPAAESGNVLAEVVGRETPDEIVVIDAISTAGIWAWALLMMVPA